jgi:hypothetical protein
VSICAVLALLFAAACASNTSVQRVIPGVSSGKYAELSESDLDAMVLCHDTLGRPDGPERLTVVTRCSPCIPYGAKADLARSWGHARRLWLQRARAPYDSLDRTANCARIAYRYALDSAPNNDSLFADWTVFRLANEIESERRTALRELDERLRTLEDDDRIDRAQTLLQLFAAGMWERAQRQLARPEDFDVSPIERRVHDLENGAPVLSRLPNIPATSKAFGVSEAEWVSAIYAQLARSTNEPAARARYVRLALAPWVTTANWRALDSAAHRLSRSAPTDSITTIAIALARYRSLRNPVSELPMAATLFDSALRAMPRVDSMRYDAFDGVLTASDDDWRYGFLPTDRLRLDLRGWAVLDPLWSTPANEIQLERRARVAEADFRYADITPNGQSGSETKVGHMLVRLGAPTDRWHVGGRSVGGGEGMLWMEGGWRSMAALAYIEELRDTWTVFYGPTFTMQRASLFPTERSSSCRKDEHAIVSLYDCALTRRADWEGVPFWAVTDTIDVTLARFRARGDSVDVYVGARVPMRSFTQRYELNAEPNSRIAISLWLTSAIGTPVVHKSLGGELPDPGLVARFAQFTGRVGSQAMMHRVEALDALRPAGARGAAQFNSAEQVAFPTKGFGMSDVLVAASIKPKSQRVPLRWTDLDMTPNGAVIAPGQRFALAWENYDLKPGPDGRVRWRVQIKREQGAVVTRADMKDVLAGSANAGTKVLANESDAPDVSFTRDAPSTDVTVDFLSTFSFDRVPVGKHVLQVLVEDLVAHTTVSRSVSVRVLDPAMQKRGTLQYGQPRPARR